jgi:hypothetical protein
MNEATEKRFARVQEANRIGLESRMLDREKKIIDRLVMAYNSGKLYSEVLFGGIAAISELRSIIHETERDLMQAADDIHSITQR